MESTTTSDVIAGDDDVIVSVATHHDVTAWSRMTSSDLSTDDVTDDVTATEQQLRSDQALNGIGTDLQAFFEVNPIVHISAVSFFTILGLAGNSLVIYIYKRKTEKFRGDIYIMLIAAVDIFACCTVLQMYPFIGYLLSNPELVIFLQLFFLLQNTTNMTYFSILGVMAFERFLAVFWPFTFREMLNKLHGIGLASYTACMLLTVSVTFNPTPFEQRTLFNIFKFLMLTWIVLTCTLYTAIAMKLYRSFKQISKYHAGQMSLSKRKQAQNSPQQTVHTISGRTERHDVTATTQVGLSSMSREVAALKLAAAILALFFVSMSVPAILGEVLGNFYFSYMSFLNHTANPWIYYVVNPTFRRDVNALFKRG